jgi:hypothetical protein
MKIFTIKYDGDSFHKWSNLGDDIQSLAAKKLLPRVDGGVSRESLAQATEPGVISMNGYFLGNRDSWPPSEALVPFFFAFHVTPNSADIVCSEKGIEYLRQFEPIGCRDLGTVSIMKNHGIDAYYTKCVTLTLERRESRPENGKVFMVGLSKGSKRAVPKNLRKRAVVIDQAKLRLPHLTPKIKEELSQHLLDTYAKHAALVITSKIHCAMPCIAMGIPVVFLYNKKCKDDYRVGIIKDLVGINYIGNSWFERIFVNPMLGKSINWSPDVLDMEEEKRSIRKSYLKAFDVAVKRYSEKFPVR